MQKLIELGAHEDYTKATSSGPKVQFQGEADGEEEGVSKEVKQAPPRNSPLSWAAFKVRAALLHNVTGYPWVQDRVGKGKGWEGWGKDG